MKPHVVGAAILDDLDSPSRILLAQRSDPAALAGLWEFPGGKVEPGESGADALQRELREELGVDSTLGAPVPADDAAGWLLGNGARMSVWLARVTGTPVPLEDHRELRWCSLADPESILDLDWIPADRPIIAAVLAQLGVSAEEF